MALEVGFWKVDCNQDGEYAKPISSLQIDSEKKLENVLVNSPDVLDEELLIIGRHIRTDFGKYIDMLAIDVEGTIHVIELNKAQTSREVVAQTLDYASWIQNLDSTNIKELYEKYNQQGNLESAFEEKFKISLPDLINDSHQITIVASNLDVETERIIHYLSSNYDVPINVVFFRFFKDGDSEYISRSWLIDPNKVEEQTNQVKKSGAKEKWNGNDYVVNFEDGRSRSWQDAMEYGFVSAGNGSWYSRTLYNLSKGNRIFCMMPGVGYIGIGEVDEEAKPLREVVYQQDDNTKRLIDYPIFEGMKHDLENDELCEHVVKVKWIAKVPLNEAFKTPGLKANQNTAFKLNHQFTIEKVTAYFNI
ncbi:hypothetical protein [Bacillus massiliigorillae]|uniref:hypothetical protein n=1 Tax=Bacillus massiliigorillae TaxID=1243664 RepID=UPI0003A145C2|nr:hypothetical protein [Bacillus massiliigorillae]